MLSILNSFERRLATLETSMVPIHQKTLGLTVASRSTPCFVFSRGPQHSALCTLHWRQLVCPFLFLQTTFFREYMDCAGVNGQKLNLLYLHMRCCSILHVPPDIESTIKEIDSVFEHYKISDEAYESVRDRLNIQVLASAHVWFAVCRCH